MGLLGDEAQVEAQFGPFGDNATLHARFSEIVFEALDGTPR
jgi:hypothetical protein